MLSADGQFTTLNVSGDHVAKGSLNVGGSPQSLIRAWLFDPSECPLASGNATTKPSAILCTLVEDKSASASLSISSIDSNGKAVDGSRLALPVEEVGSFCARSWKNH